jgi:hypothetical protein
MYDDIVRVVGKNMVKEYPIMKQGNKLDPRRQDRDLRQGSQPHACHQP